MNDQETINYTDYKNTFFNILNFLASPIAMFFAIPIFIYYLGIEKFGIWILINSIINTIRFVDAGLGNSIIKFVSKYKARNDFLNINRIINNSFLIFFIIIFITLLISLFVFLQSPKSRFLQAFHRLFFYIALNNNYQKLYVVNEYNLSSCLQNRL